MHNRPSYLPPRERLPIRLLAAVALALILLAAALAGWLAWQFTRLEPFVASVLRVALFAAPLVAGGVALAIAWRRWASIELLKADRVVALTQAQQQKFPAALTSLSYHDSSRPVMQQSEEPPLLPEPEPASVPTFGQLLDQGKIGPGQPLLLGFDAASGDPIEGSWDDLYSVGVGGMTGSGKSWLAAFLIAQSAAAGARIILIDPHAVDPQSLATRIAGLSSAFMCDVAQSGTAIESALKLAADKLDGRRKGRGGAWPLLLICDEWTSLLRGKLGDLLTATALDFAEEGRKFGCFAMLAAQAWQVEAAGPVRDRLASHYAMRTRGDQFRYQLGLRGSAPLDTLFLKPGEAYFLATTGDLTKVIIPRMEPADLAHVGAMISQPAASVGQPFGFDRVTATVTPAAELVTARRHDGDTMATSATPVTTAAGSAKPVSPEAARALDLLHEGKSIPAIVKELRNVVPREGRRYMTALDEVTDLLRQATKGGR